MTHKGSVSSRSATSITAIAAAALLALLSPDAAAAAIQPTDRSADTTVVESPAQPAAASSAASSASATSSATSTGATTETVCDDGIDDDGDTVVDCADHDCAASPACRPDGQIESTEARCSDWVDNDSNGFSDCDDTNCDGTKVCMGSWDLQAAGEPVESGEPSMGAGTTTSGAQRIILKPGENPDDLLNRDGLDAGGERTNLFCSDGIDNDGDGLTDCEDIGCRLSSEVSVCQPTGNIRFSVVARVGHNMEMPSNVNANAFNQNTSFDALQLRALGQLPFIQNSFFLLSTRFEKSPRMTFAMFQIPIKNGHYFNVNSGGGGLSLELVRSVHKRLLVDPAYYVYNAFEQGNGAALEFGGPLDKQSKFLYRTYFAGGSGRYAGNVGGNFFPDNNRNFTYSAGAQIHMNLLGYYSRFDSPMLYTPVPLTLTLTAGGKFDQRAAERYPAVNIQSVFRWKRFQVMGEIYGKRELVFKNWQMAYNIQVGVLAIKRRLLLAADFGQYLATDFENPPDPGNLPYDLRRQTQEMQYRIAAHVYLWRDIWLLQLAWQDRRVENTIGSVTNTFTGERIELDTMENPTFNYQTLRLLFLYRF
jgi:hypothetical protein